MKGGRVWPLNDNNCTRSVNESSSSRRSSIPDASSLSSSYTSSGSSATSSAPSSSALSMTSTSSATSSVASSQNPPRLVRASTSIEKKHAIIKALEEKLTDRRAKTEKIAEIEKFLDFVDSSTTAILKDLGDTIDEQRDQMTRRFSGKVEKEKRVEKRKSTKASVVPKNTTEDNAKLLKMERQIGRLDHIESQLNAITNMAWQQTRPPSSTMSASSVSQVPPTKEKSYGQIYGVNEVDITYKQADAKIRKAMDSLIKLRTEPAVYRAQPGGLSHPQEIETLIAILSSFSAKLGTITSSYHRQIEVRDRRMDSCIFCDGEPSSYNSSIIHHL